MPDIKFYRMRPVIKEAMRLTEDNLDEAMLWVQDNGAAANWVKYMNEDKKFIVRTHMGDMSACPGDWLIRGLEGEFYPVQDSKFQATYEEIS